MTQDHDDILAQVFSVLPTLESQTVHDVNGNKEEQEIAANVRRVSNAFQDFMERSGVVETTISHTEYHTETHHQVVSHVDTHHEVVTIGAGVQIQHEAHHETVGHGVEVHSHEEHLVIGHGVNAVEHYEHHNEPGHGVSVISAESNPPETHAEEHVTLGAGAVPHHAAHDDEESVISVRTGLSQATSVSVHSSVSQKSVQIYADAPVIVKASSRHSQVSQKSSVVPESHHSEVAHTHDRESTISSAKSSASTLTGSAASKNTTIEQYVFVEKPESHHEHHHHEQHHHHHDHHHHVVHHHATASHDSTPIAVMKSDPHDALIEEFKLRHQRAPSEVSSFVAAPVSAPPPPPTVPPPADSDAESDVVMTVKVTQYEFDSHEIKHSVEHHHENHEHNRHHEVHEEAVQNGYVHQHEPKHHLEEHIHHNGFDSHAVGHGVAPHHHVDEDDFHFEEAVYHEKEPHEHYEPISDIHDHVSIAPSEPRSEVPPVFFQSPVLARKAPPQTTHHLDSDSDESIHHHHAHHEHHVHRELIPNISGPHVRDDFRPATVTEEHHHVTVVKTVPTPVAHVQPVVSHQERGLPRIDNREILAPHADSAPMVHKIEAHHHEGEHHLYHHETEHHHHDHHITRHEKHYHKHDDQLSEVFSGPSVRDLKSRFEQRGEVTIHYGTHYISHKKENSAAEDHQHHHHHDHLEEHAHHEHVHQKHADHAHHEHHAHHGHYEPIAIPVSVPGGQPRLPHREFKEEHVHHHHHHHHHHHEPEHVQVEAKTVEHHDHGHHHHEVEVQQVHEEHTHHHDHHEHHHHDHHEEVHHIQQAAEAEDQLPVSVLLSRYGGGAKLRHPDHHEEIKIYSRASSVPNVSVVHEVHQHIEEPPKSRTVTQSSVSTASKTRSQSTYSIQTSHRSHASTLTQEHYNAQVAVAPALAAPVAAARTSPNDHQSLRVVKSVRAFVNEWGKKDFQPPMSPMISVPRLPTSPKSPVEQFFPEPVSRKSTVLSNASHTTHTTHHSHESHKPEHHVIKTIEDDQASVCTHCTDNKARGKSVSSIASTVTTNYTSAPSEVHHIHQESVVAHIGEGAHPQIPEVHEEFVLTPLAERRALFEHGLNRGYSINRKTHGELRPMVNVFTD